MTIELRQARPDEHLAVSALALRSKGHWGHDAEFLEACRAELTWGPERMVEVVVAESDGAVVGFHLLEPVESEAHVGELAALFVDPPSIGSGVGRLLLRDALAHAVRRGWRAVRLDADPDAEAFYLSQGARRIGESPSGSIAGRVLPRLEFEPE